MKRQPMIWLGLVLVLCLVFPAEARLAAPLPQGAPETIQIVLVLDVSGSMATPVFTGIVPEDLLALLLRMDELTRDQEYADLQIKVEDAENDPDVREAQEARYQAFEDLSAWIASSQSLGLPGTQSAIRAILRERDCRDTSDRLIATAGSSEQIMFALNADCPAASNKWSLLTDILELLPYLDDPAYQSLREEWQLANLAYDQALNAAGYSSYSDQLEQYKRTTGMDALQGEIDRLVVEYGIPSRLDLAKTAAANLLDLAELDREHTGRDSSIGLVTFSDQALLEHSLTLAHEALRPLIDSMQPLEQTNIGDSLSLGLAELETQADNEMPMLVILLSDGHANVGLSSSQILAVIPDRANRNEVKLCTAGFADLETEVDFLLLEGLAYETGGEYLFTNSGAELGSFFAACREAAAGRELAGRMSGILAAGDIQQIGQVVVRSNTCELSLALNFLSGTPALALTDPDGEVLDLEGEGISYQARNQVQLLSVAYPQSGEWAITLANEDPDGEGAAYSLLLSTVPCSGEDSPLPADLENGASVPFLLTSQGLSALTGGLVVLVLLLGGGVFLLIGFRQRRAE